MPTSGFEGGPGDVLSAYRRPRQSVVNLPAEAMAHSGPRCPPTPEAYAVSCAVRRQGNRDLYQLVNGLDPGLDRVP